jgi:sarcosine oxidase delta subunit
MLKDQIAAVTHAELQLYDTINRMKERGVEAEHIEHWQGVARDLAAARETLRLLLVAEEARQALAAHLAKEAR